MTPICVQGYGLDTLVISVLLAMLAGAAVMAIFVWVLANAPTSINREYAWWSRRHLFDTARLTIEALRALGRTRVAAPSPDVGGETTVVLDVANSDDGTVKLPPHPHRAGL